MTTTASEGAPASRRGATPGSREFLAIVTACMATSALSIDLLLPAMAEMRQDFGLDPDATEISQILTTYFLGLALGQLFYGPLSDRFGRKRMLEIGLAIFALAAVAAAFQTTLAGLVVCRFVWGLGAAAPRSIAIAMVRDTFEGDHMARIMSLIMAVFVLVPVFAPSVGAGVLQLTTWQGVVWVQAAFGIALALWSIRLPETLHPEDRRSVSPRALATAARAVVSNRQTVGFTIAITAAFGIMTSYLGSSEIVIDEVFGQGDLFPVIFGLLACTLAVGSLLSARMVMKVGLTAVVRVGSLYLLASCAALGVLALVTDGSPPLWAFGVAVAALLPGISALIPSCNTAAMAPLGRVAGMGSAIVGTVTTAGGAILGNLTDSAYDGSVTPLALHMAAYAAVFTAAILFVASSPTRVRAVDVEVAAEPLPPN